MFWNKFIQYIQANYAWIILECYHQLVYLIIFPVFIACCIGIPLGILISKYKKLSFISKLISILQTIPSLIMLTLMIIIGLGIGYKPAIVAITLYSLLYIVNNTYIGIKSVNPIYIDNSKYMGMTDLQILYHTQLPIALPIILTGIRLALISASGCSVLANMIGAGGLGIFINTGINQLQYHIALIGIIPTMVISVTIDQVFNLIINKVKKEV